jgi:hypothetical protein
MMVISCANDNHYHLEGQGKDEGANDYGATYCRGKLEAFLILMQLYLVDYDAKSARLIHPTYLFAGSLFLPLWLIKK